MSIPIKLTVFTGPDMAVAKSLPLSDGIILAVKLDEWARDTRAFIATLPPNVVQVPEALLAELPAARDAGDTKRAWELVDAILAQLGAKP